MLGICGGLQMLGGRIRDPAGVDGSAEGLGLLPVRTVFAREKRTEQVESRFSGLEPPWDALNDISVSGYEIRHGDVAAADGAPAVLEEERGFQNGPVLGVTLHGLFESSEVVAALTGSRPGRSLDAVFDGLADLVEERLALDRIAELAGVAA